MTSRVLQLVKKSKLEIVDWAYTDLLDWGVELTDNRLIEEIEWKLECAEDSLDFDQKKITKTRKFLNKLKEL